MTKRSIGMVLSQLIDESNLSIAQVADIMGKTRQNVYVDLKRTSIKDEVIKLYAQALNISKEEIYSRWHGQDGETTSNQTDLLAEQIRSIETYFKEIVNQQLAAKDQQLAAKDRQIEKLMELLGKPKDVMQLVANPIIPLNSQKEARA